VGGEDVPSPIDFRDPAQARAWVEETVKTRPYRPAFFAAFAEALGRRFDRPIDVLELGSGPGHLAQSLIGHTAIRRYVALDFSEAMHAIAREVLGPLGERVEFTACDFREPDFARGLGSFDAVVTMQAAHEMRHRRHLVRFLETAASALKDGGILLYSDHYAEPGNGKNPDLMETRQRQKRALEQAGLIDVMCLLDEGGMALYQAVKPEITIPP